MDHEEHCARQSNTAHPCDCGTDLGNTASLADMIAQAYQRGWITKTTEYQGT